MRESALAARPRRRFVRTTDTAHDEPVFPNLLHDVQPDGPNQVWVADLTYLRLEREFAYLAVILDAWSRKVVGYAVGHVLDVRLPLAALEAALESRRPPPGLLHHWGREVQYALWRYRERLAEAGLRGSMSRTGNPYDNAAGGELHENPETRGGLPARLGHGAGRDRPAPLLPGGRSTTATVSTRPWAIGLRRSTRPNMRRPPRVPSRVHVTTSDIRTPVA